MNTKYAVLIPSKHTDAMFPDYHDPIVVPTDKPLCIHCWRRPQRKSVDTCRQCAARISQTNRRNRLLKENLCINCSTQPTELTSRGKESTYCRRCHDARILHQTKKRNERKGQVVLL